MRKRIFALILAVSMVLSIVPGTAFAVVSENIVTLSAPEKVIATAITHEKYVACATVDLSITENTGFAGGGVLVGFNTKVFELFTPDPDEVTENPELVGCTISGLTVNIGPQKIVAFTMGSTSKTGILASVKFNVLKGAVNGIYPISFTTDAFTGKDDGDIPEAVVNGSIEVTNGIPVTDVTPTVAAIDDIALTYPNTSASELTASASVNTKPEHLTYAWYAYDNETKQPYGEPLATGATWTPDVPEYDASPVYYCCVATNTYNDVEYDSEPEVFMVSNSKAELGAASLSETEFTYTGNEQGPTVTVAGESDDSEYIVNGDDPKTKVGNYTITVTPNPDGNYTGEPQQLPWKITPATITTNESLELTVYNKADDKDLGEDELGIKWAGSTGESDSGVAPNNYTITYAEKTDSNLIDVVVDPEDSTLYYIRTLTEDEGTATVTATITDNDGNHTTKTVDITVKVVNKAAATVTLTPVEKYADGYEDTYKVDGYTLSDFIASIGIKDSQGQTPGDVSADLYLDGEAASLDTELPNAGSYEVEAVYETSREYGAATATITITKAEVTKPTANTGLTYTGDSLTGVTANDLDSLYTLTAGTAAETNAGSYSATYTLKDTTNYKWANTDDDSDPLDVTWSIARQGIDVPTGATLTYTGSEQTGVAEDAAKYTFADNSNKATNAGAYTAKVTPTDNYQWNDGTTDEKDVSFTINRKEITPTITVDITSYTYGDEVNPTVTVKDGETTIPKTEYTVTYDPALDTINAGEITVTVADAANGNYKVANATATITISKKDISATDVNTSTTIVKGIGTFTEPSIAGVNGETVTGTMTYTYDGMDYTSVADLVTELAKLSTGANGTIGWSFTAADNGNYTGTVTGSISFNVVDIAFTDANGGSAANAITVATDATYGDKWSEIVTVNKDNLVAKVGETTVTGTYSIVDADTIPDVGATYTVVFNSADRRYQDVTVHSAVASIAKAKLTIEDATIADSKEYDGNTTATVTAATLEGIVNNDTLTFGTDFDVTAEYENANVGTNKTVAFTLTLKGTDVTKNYEVNTADLHVTYANITAKALTVESHTIAATDRAYDGTNVVALTGAIVLDGIVGDDDVSAVVPATGTVQSADASTEPKAVTITGVTLSGTDAGNYTLSAQPTGVTVTISKATWTETSDATEALYGSTVEFALDVAPGGTASFTSYTDSNTILAETLTSDSVANNKLTYKLVDKNTEDVKDKTATVTLKVENATNYEDYDLVVTITLRVKKPQAELTINPTTATYGQTTTLTTTGGSTNGTVTYSVSDETIATVSGNVLTPVKAGTVKITATMAGDAEYADVTSAEYTLTIAKATPTGTPSFNYVYSSSNTLADVNLAIGTITPAEGELKWELADTTKVEMSKAYKWIFTPTDTTNYTTLEGEITPYTRPNLPPPPGIGSGNTSGSSTSGNVTTVTTTNPDGSTNTIVTDKTTGTVTNTTSYPDGSITRIETKADGTVTTTTRSNRNVVVKTVRYPNAPATVSVTMPASVGETAISVPVNATASTVAVDAVTGETLLSAPTSAGLGVMVSGNTEIIIRDNAKYFVDVHPVDHWADTYVDFVSSRNLFGGVSVNEFAPDDPMTRAMLMTVMARLDGVDTTGSDPWYFIGMNWAVSSGLSDGSAGERNLTRAELATMLYRYAGSPAVSAADLAALDSFADADDIQSWACNAMAWAVSEGFINGVGSNKLAPEGNATRAMVAAIFMRYVTYLVK